MIQIQTFFKKMDVITDSLPLPDSIKDSILGIVNAISRNAGVNKFLFEGAPGTGKTESVKQIARILDRTNSNDLREMGRAMSSALKGLDNMNDNVVLSRLVKSIS